MGRALAQRLEVLHVTALLANADDVARLHDIGGDVHLLAVDGDVAVADKLTSLRTGGGQAQAVDDIVQAALEQGQQVVARDALDARGLVKRAAELRLQHAVGAADLLLFAQLHAVLAHLSRSSLPVHAGRRGALADRALGGVAAVALQKQLRAFAPAQAADGTSITCHWALPPTLFCAWADGIRCGGWGSRP